MNMITKTAFLACVLAASFANANETEMNEVKIEVKLLCPSSEELQNLRDAIPAPERASVDTEEWKQSFIAAMKRTIELVESDKISDRFWSAHVQDVKAETQE
ncbi:MAG TPA: hypothetical protein VIJ14_04225 [Rhabdochlamydiaceae bacterium]